MKLVMSKRCVVCEMVQKLRVLHILGELNPSGAECMLKVAATTFAAHGISSEILSTGSTDVGSYASQMTKVGYKVHHIPFKKSIAFVVQIYCFLHAQRYDVVHIHSERANFWLGLSAYLSRVPRIISTAHGTFAFNGLLRLKRMIFRQLLQRLGVVQISIGPSVQETEWKYFRRKTRIIPNWYDSTKFRPPTQAQRAAARSKYGLENDTFVISSVGNCSKIKNHSILIEAISLLSAELPIVYLHVGAEEQGFPERQLAENVGIDKQIHFLGQLEDPLPVLYASDLYVMPSLSEGFGIAALEAAAVGLPMVLSNVSGLRDFKQVFEQVYYAEPAVSDLRLELEKAITRHRCRVGAKTTQTDTREIREQFGIERGTGDYIKLYHDSLKS